MIDEEAYRKYLESFHASNKANYWLESQKELKRIKEKYTDRRPRLLLHVCCGPCAAWPLEFLQEHFDVTIMYNNSNIWPQSEYSRRLDTLKQLLELSGSSVPVIATPYDNDAYNEKLAPYAEDPEGWTRCFLCYRLRMDEAYAYAEANGFDYFTTVMTISRQKNSRKLNEIGLELQEKYPSVRWFPCDFKKKGGQVRRDELVSQYCLYCQDYCGCIYSYYARHPEQKR